MSFSIDGLEELQRRILQVQRNLEAAYGPNGIPLLELMPDEFMTKYTDFVDLPSMIDAAQADEGICIGCDGTGLTSEEFNDYVARKTRFSDWNNMVEQATTDQTARTPIMQTPTELSGWHLDLENGYRTIEEFLTSTASGSAETTQPHSSSYLRRERSVLSSETR